jgi:hypothetical protein
MNEAIFVGVYPGLDRPQLDHIAATILSLIAKHRSSDASKA